MGIYLLMLVPLMFAVLLAIFGMQSRKARRDALSAAAADMGWSFDPASVDGGGGWLSEPGRSDTEPYRRFEVFTEGHDREFRNTMSGELVARAGDGGGGGGLRMRCEAGDFSWVTGSGKRSQTHRRSYLLFNLGDELGVTPDLALRPEGWSDRLFSALSGGDINFESEEFSRLFHVTSGDKRFAYGVIDPQMIEFLMSTSQQRVAIIAGWGLVVSEEDEWEALDFKWVTSWVCEFMDHWPEYLVKQCREGGW